ncbi:MAG: hypothetical protein K8S99_13030 [Planctomycetes bacterium]|nr:hypothetical protein [Planctomycetota bacterium]
MSATILWSPRVILAGRTFRLPVRGEGAIRLDPGPLRIHQTSAPCDGVTRFFLTAPDTGCDAVITATDAAGKSAPVTVRVRTLDQLRADLSEHGHDWPRRWPMDRRPVPFKSRQTLDAARADLGWGNPLDETSRGLTDWHLSLSDAQAWNLLPPAEWPIAYSVNKIEGCPVHGTAIFAHGGFYPWKHNHTPPDYKCICPIGNETFPSNPIQNGDYLSGDYPDDGFGYVDAQGHAFHAVAYYRWTQNYAFHGEMVLLARAALLATEDAQRLRLARRAGLMLARLAVEELYLAAAPQFRYGSHFQALEKNLWGPPDVAGHPEMMEDHTVQCGTVYYSVSFPYCAKDAALAYDAIWPIIKDDAQLAAMVRAMGVAVASAADVRRLIEDMIAVHIQGMMDGVGHSNHPGTSLGLIGCLRALDPPEFDDLLTHIYDDSKDQLRTFVSNGFYPDGVCYEASGGYNGMHIMGAIEAHRQLEALRAQRPDAMSNERFPAMDSDPRYSLMTLPQVQTVLCGKTWAAYGDDRAPGSQAEGTSHSHKLTDTVSAACFWGLRRDLFVDVFQRSPNLTLARFMHACGCGDADPRAAEMVKQHGPAQQHPTLHMDHGGIGVLRLHRADGTDRAAVFVHYLCQPFHRHDDFLDTSIVAFDRAWHACLGYPATHETCSIWEGNWAAHNRGQILNGRDADMIATGHCNTFLDGEHAVAIDAGGFQGHYMDWRLFQPDPSREHRRLVVLVPTVGEGLAVVDLMRLRGGREHWRTYRGPLGETEIEGVKLTPRGGSAAGVDVTRADARAVGEARAGLAHIDEIKEGDGSGDWVAQMRYAGDEPWRVTLHALGTPGGTRLMVGRAGHPLTKPEESPYRFSPIVLCHDVADEGLSCFDWVLEPNQGKCTVTRVERHAPLDAAAAEAVAVTLHLSDGARAVVMWNPSPLPTAGFEGGLSVTGPLSVARLDPAGKLRAVSVQLGGSATVNGETRRASRGAAVGRVVEVELESCSLTVRLTGDELFRAGARVRFRRRGHWYTVAHAEEAGQGMQRLTLDLTAIISSAPFQGFEEEQLRLGSPLHLAWAGYFRHCTARSRKTGAMIDVLDVRMREDRQYSFAMIDGPTTPEQRAGFTVGEWVDLLEYAPGDVVTEQGYEWTGR